MGHYRVAENSVQRGPAEYVVSYGFGGCDFSVGGVLRRS